MIKKSDITTEFVKEKVNEFNKRVERLTGEGLEFLQPVDADNLFKLSEVQIARELNFMEKLADKKYQKLVPYSPESPVKVPRFVKIQAERNIEKITGAIDKIKGDVEVNVTVGGMQMLRNESLVPPTLGPGKNKESVQRRLKTLQNLAQPNYYKESLERYKQNYLGIIDEYLGPYAGELRTRLSRIPPEEIFRISLHPLYGHDMSIEYIYGFDSALNKYNEITAILDIIGY